MTKPEDKVGTISEVPKLIFRGTFIFKDENPGDPNVYVYVYVQYVYLFVYAYV